MRSRLKLTGQIKKLEELHNTRVENQKNALDVYRIAANKTALVNNSHFGHEFTTIAL